MNVSTQTDRMATVTEGPRTVVLCPPREVAAADDVVEDEADDGPADVVERRRRRDESCAAEDDGPVEVLEDHVVEALLQQPLSLRSSVTMRPREETEVRTVQSGVAKPTMKKKRSG